MCVCLGTINKNVVVSPSVHGQANWERKKKITLSLANRLKF